LPAGKAKLGTARIFMTPPSMLISCTSTTLATGDWAEAFHIAFLQIAIYWMELLAFTRKMAQSFATLTLFLALLKKQLSLQVLQFLFRQMCRYGKQRYLVAVY
jgi:hypothetical protein